MADRSKTPTVRDKPVTRPPPLPRHAKPTAKQPPAAPKPADPDDDATTVRDPRELPRPPELPAASAAPAPAPARQFVRAQSHAQSPAHGVVAVSKKTPGTRRAADVEGPAVPRVKLRAMSEVASGPHAAPQQLGYLAPPRDPREARSRRRGDLVVWGSVCVMIACAIALGIWFLAR